MSEIETKLYDAMGQRFAVVKIVGSLGVGYMVTAHADSFCREGINEKIVENLRYSEAQAIIKLLGDSDGGS